MSDAEVNVGRVVTDLSGVYSTESAAPDKLLDESVQSSTVDFGLHDGTAYSIDKRDPRFAAWITFLKERRESGNPVYVKSEKGSVKEVFAPSLRRVHAIREERGDDRHRLVVFLLPTPSARFLNPARDGFDEMRTKLEAALGSGEQVLVTVDPYNDEIVDVRDVELAHDEGTSNGPAVAVAVAVTEVLPVTFEAESLGLNLTPISLRDAFREFDFLASRPFIPFSFIKDCCSARAHEMCELMRRRGVESGKLFLYGSGFNQAEGTLVGFHEDNPGVVASWLFHVAPVVSVMPEDGDGGGARLMVMDPSEFNSPRSEPTWVSHHQDSGATTALAAANVFFRFPDGEVIPDDDFSQTNLDLEKHRHDRNLLRSPRPSQ